MFSRVEMILKTKLQDPKGLSLFEKIQKWNPSMAAKIESLRVVDLFWTQFEGGHEEFEKAAKDIWWDEVLQQKEWPQSDWVVEREYHPGMTDNLGHTGLEALEICCQRSLANSKVISGQAYLFRGADLTREDIETLTRILISNALIHRHRVYSQSEFAKHPRFESSEIAPKFAFPTTATPKAQTLALAGMSDEALIDFSRKNLLSLTLSEMKAIQTYFISEKRDPTDVEVEILAQTWSEHCKHKIFAADVEYTEEGPEKSEIPAQIPGLFKTTIAGTTKELPKPWLLSVFKDNAGIVAFSEDEAVCIKVETHNSPSALDPFGGAITGIVGVNRDILGCGFGAKPIFNTDVFCVGPLEMKKDLPTGIIPPAQLLEGIRSGVEAGGNQSGIPTVNGALYFDETFIGKPLVFCGSGGIMPRKIADKFCYEKEIQNQDLICMVGGRIGRDGIHGATFSSLEMTESIPSSVVQLGDPITQRRMTDFLIEARDRGLYRTLTDNGAGGLSSSVGEMAELAGGARMDVALAKTKMPGLKPFELVISESQERMTVAVPPENRQKFLDLATRRGVEVSVLGEFNSSGRFEIFYGADKVADLSLQFLHKGCPTLKLKAHWTGKTIPAMATAAPQDPQPFATLKKILRRPNIRSKENMIRQYDHEVQGRSVVKSLQTSPQKRTSPNDAAVLALSPDKLTGVTVASGLNPRLSLVDPYLMAQAAVDEAVRNLLCVGSEFSLGDESVLSLIDNFCWPDPVEDAEKMAALVRTCYGLRKACLELKAPLISGKDSMKNDYKGTQGGQPVKISVLPTLLVTAMGRIPDYTKARTAEFKKSGDRVYKLGPSQLGLAQSEWHRLQDQNQTWSVAQPHWKKAVALYQWLGSPDSSNFLRSAHDLSEGGLLTALAESCFAHHLGLEFAAELNLADVTTSFGEGFHQVIVSVEAEKAAAAEALWQQKGIDFVSVGTLTAKPAFTWKSETVSIDELYQAWSGESL